MFNKLKTKIKMKKSIVTLAILASIVASANPFSNYALEQTAQQLVAALKSASAEKYVALYPSVDEFKKLMSANAFAYGPYLKEAQEEFATQFNSKLMPELKASFDALIKEGEAKGIVWSEVEFISTEVGQHTEGELSTAMFTLAISYKGKVYGIVIDEALLMNGQWRVSKFIKFV
jgi:hypothetical protein